MNFPKHLILNASNLLVRPSLKARENVSHSYKKEEQIGC